MEGITFRVRCSGALHRISVTNRGKIVLHNHDKENLEGLEALRLLGGQPCKCLLARADLISRMRNKLYYTPKRRKRKYDREAADLPAKVLPKAVADWVADDYQPRSRRRRTRWEVVAPDPWDPFDLARDKLTEVARTQLHGLSRFYSMKYASVHITDASADLKKFDVGRSYRRFMARSTSYLMLPLRQSAAAVFYCGMLGTYKPSRGRPRQHLVAAISHLTEGLALAVIVDVLRSESKSFSNRRAIVQLARKRGEPCTILEFIK